jgi:taurine-pyruvate aminotransferase
MKNLGIDKNKRKKGEKEMGQARGFDAGQLSELSRKHLWLHISNHKVFEGQAPLIMVSGQGCMVKDIQGNEYLDGVSGGVWCVNVGYGRESIAKAVYDQLTVLPYYAGSAGNPPYIMLAAKLASLVPELEKAFISNSGSEANEKAFKMVRQLYAQKYPGKRKYKIVYRARDYHGTTLATISASGQQERKLGYEPFLDGFAEMPHALCYRCHFGKSYPGCNIECAHALEDVVKKEGPDSVAAVILEPITAGGGIIVPVTEYYPIIQEICRKYGMLLIMDEVVNGFGRTGKMFGFQHYKVSPDIVTAAKGIASAYMPLSITMAKKEIFDEFIVDTSDTLGYFRDISTYGGCAAACAAAIENIRIIEDENLVDQVASKGEYLLTKLEELEQLPIVGEVRGKGLFAGIELVQDKKTKKAADERILAQVVGEAKAQGVLIGRMNRSVPGLNNVVTMAPPYIITKDEIDRIVNTIRDALLKIR